MPSPQPAPDMPLVPTWDAGILETIQFVGGDDPPRLTVTVFLKETGEPTDNWHYPAREIIRQVIQSYNGLAAKDSTALDLANELRTSPDFGRQIREVQCFDQHGRGFRFRQ